MSDPQTTTPSVPVVDQRPTPRGVLPRHVQTWVMAGIALVMVGIIVLTGRPDAVERTVTATTTPQPPNPDRVRDFQDRLRVFDTRSALDAQAVPPTASPAVMYPQPATGGSEDPLAAERRRRDYESLFASNVVSSRRPDLLRPDAGSVGSTAAAPTSEPRDPSIDDIADAVLRASARSGLTTATGASSPAAQPTAAATAPPQRGTGAITADGPMHRLLEGTVIDAVLTNRLDGAGASPLNCLVTNPIYSHSRQHVLIPAGARVLGETKPVQAIGETRLAVSFHRLVMPDGRTFSLDQFLGTNQVGDAGLRDRVNQHYWSTFGAAAAVGLISGLAHWIGSAGFGDDDRTVVIAGSAGDATAQASAQTMNRFLNRLPTITIREGHRVKVYLTGDLELPAYEAAAR